nr:cell division protein ZapB [uncultured Arsenicibacter sp.]
MSAFLFLKPQFVKMEVALYIITLLFSLISFPIVAQQNLVIQSPLSATPGWNNTLIGEKAGENIITGLRTGAYNTFIGCLSGQYTTSGYNNVLIGSESGRMNTTGMSNTFLGNRSGKYNTTGHHNVFIGADVGMSNITGHNNVFVGHIAGDANISGENNIFLGNSSGLANTYGNLNVYIGLYSGLNSTIGMENVFIGNNSGAVNKTGSRNTLIGSLTNILFDNLTNATAIGYDAKVSVSNAIVLDDTTSGIKVGIGTTAPQFPLDVKGTINIRGTGGKLKFTHLINSDFRKEGNDHFLTVNEQGEVTLSKYRMRIGESNEWSDRVFAGSYRLATLEEVEQFIRTKQHLPGIPSAQEVTEKGVDPSQFSAKLLEKIEELTLYMINTHKENQQLKQRLEKLETENKKLLQEIKRAKQ